MCRGMLVQLKLSQASDNTAVHSVPLGEAPPVSPLLTPDQDSAHAGICPGRTPPTPDSANVGLFVAVPGHLQMKTQKEAHRCEAPYLAGFMVQGP
ncbi:unnamed protein product [Arctogadus glacialis]